MANRDLWEDCCFSAQAERDGKENRVLGVFGISTNCYDLKNRDKGTFQSHKAVSTTG